MRHYHAKQLFDGEHFLHDVRLSVSDGLIIGISEQPQKTDVVLDGLVSAGYVDTQVNGGGGLLFNQQPHLSTLRTMLAAHSQFGTTAMLPTLITDSLEVMQRAADAVAEAVQLNEPGIVGVHFEGPHLSIAKRGIHADTQIRSLSDAELALFCRQDLGKVMITVAPENVTPDLIRDLVKQGVVVALGHSAATVETVLQAIEAGASGFTHLFNAMSGLSARDPGMIAAALHDSRVYCGLIADLIHVHPYNGQLAYRCKNWQRLMLVTDAMAHVGCDLDVLPWLDTQITRHGNKLTLDNGTIAGSALDMASAVRNAHQHMHIELGHALNMASLSPATFAGLEQLGQLKVGKQADFILLDRQLSIVSSWIKGERQVPQTAKAQSKG
jgi:N-acetylglucosamine-6-phosphate deacetylase